MAKTTDETNQTLPAYRESKWPRIRRVLIVILMVTKFIIIDIPRWCDKVTKLWEYLKSWLADL